MREKGVLVRLVVVSNRVSVPKSSSSAAGGLALALRQAIQAPGGLWFGWSGRVNETPVKEPQIVTRRRVSYITLDLSRADYESFYVGYANSTLWPLLHFRLGFLEYRREEFEGYLTRLRLRPTRYISTT
jgi:trehalose 6-phosphate synthase